MHYVILLIVILVFLAFAAVALPIYVGNLWVTSISFLAGNESIWNPTT